MTRSWRRGRGWRCPVPPRSTPSRERPTPSTPGGVGPNPSSRSCTPIQSIARPSRPCRRRWWPRCPTGTDTCGPRPRLLGSAGPDGGLPWWDLFAPVGDPSAASIGWEEATATVTDSFAGYSAGPGRAGPPGPERGLDRRRSPGRQAGRCLLHGHDRRGEPGAAQLRFHLQLRLHPRPRAGPRLPQHHPGPGEPRCNGTPLWPWPRPRPSSARPC